MRLQHELDAAQKEAAGWKAAHGRRQQSDRQHGAATPEAEAEAKAEAEAEAEAEAKAEAEAETEAEVAEAEAGRWELAGAPLATSSAALTKQPWTAMSLAVLDSTARSPVPGKDVSSAR